jgi:hypothetical protein
MASDIEMLVGSLKGNAKKLAEEYNIITPEIFNSEDEEMLKKYSTYNLWMELINA